MGPGKTAGYRQVTVMDRVDLGIKKLVKMNLGLLLGANGLSAR